MNDSDYFEDLTTKSLLDILDKKAKVQDEESEHKSQEKLKSDPRYKQLINNQKTLIRYKKLKEILDNADDYSENVQGLLTNTDWNTLLKNPKAIEGVISQGGPIAKILDVSDEEAESQLNKN
jgi:hypothetical protein